MARRSETVTETASVDPLTEPVPEGYDEAIYRDARRASREWLLAGSVGAEPVNPFAAGTPQADSWEERTTMARRSETVTETASVDPLTEPVPEGYDEAIYRDAQRASREWLLAGSVGAEPVNPFAAGTPQADSWDAGYAAGPPPSPPSPPPPAD